MELRFAAAALRVTGRDEPPGDVPKVQARMAGPEVLDAARFAQIRFRSTAVSVTPAGGAAFRVDLRGELELRATRGPVDVPLTVELAGDELRARGEVRLRQTAVGVNFIDVYCRTGYFPLAQPPAVLGMEAAGVVLDVYPQAYKAWIKWEKFCYAGKDSAITGEPEAFGQAAREILDRGFDAVVFGHTHQPGVREYGEQVYVNSGSWMLAPTCR